MSRSAGSPEKRATRRTTQPNRKDPLQERQIRGSDSREDTKVKVRRREGA